MALATLVCSTQRSTAAGSLATTTTRLHVNTCIMTLPPVNKSTGTRALGRCHRWHPNEELSEKPPFLVSVPLNSRSAFLGGGC